MRAYEDQLVYDATGGDEDAIENDGFECVVCGQPIDVILGHNEYAVACDDGDGGADYGDFIPLALADQPEDVAYCEYVPQRPTISVRSRDGRSMVEIPNEGWAHAACVVATAVAA